MKDNRKITISTFLSNILNASIKEGTKKIPKRKNKKVFFLSRYGGIDWSKGIALKELDCLKRSKK